MWSNICSKIFSQLITALECNHIRYFILRNYEGLPDINPAKDVDIVIEPGSYSRAAELIRAIYEREGAEYIYVARFERARCWYGLSLSRDFAIHIDLIEGYVSKGIELIDFEELYRNTTQYNGLVVLNDEYGTVMLLLYKIIMARQLKLRYRIEISEGYRRNAQRVRRILLTKVSRRVAIHIYHLIESGDFDALEQISGSISRSAKWRAFWLRPAANCVGIIKFFAQKFYRIVICPQRFRKFIAVQGADGTGKTTFIEGLVGAVAKYYMSDRARSHIYHHRPTILPNLGSVGERAGVMVADKDFETPHRGAAVGWLSSLLRMIYYWLDYLIGVPCLLRRDVQYDRFTIYDRYIYDFLIDPKRSRIYLPYWVRWLFTRLVVQPSIVFILVADVETIYGRKQELTKPEIERQLMELKRLASQGQQFVVIDASQQPDEMVREASKVILDKFFR